MFRSKEINGSAAIEAPPPSPAAIAASVKHSAAHAELAERIAKLDAERQAAFDEMRALIATNSSEQNDPAVRKAAKRREKIEDTLRPLRMEIRPLRAEHAERVREALVPAMRENARALIRALAELSAAAAFLNDCETEIERAGGQVSYDRIQTNFGPLEWRLRNIAGLGDGS